MRVMKQMGLSFLKKKRENDRIRKSDLMIIREPSWFSFQISGCYEKVADFQIVLSACFFYHEDR